MCVLYYRSLKEYKLFIESYKVRKSHRKFLRKIHFTVNHTFKFYRSQLYYCYYFNKNHYLIVEIVLKMCVAILCSKPKKASGNDAF